MFTFSTTLFEVLWAELRLPPAPAPIAVPQHGATLEERSHIRAAALAEAQQLGIGHPPNLDHRLVDLFDLLARPAKAVSLRELAGQRRRAYAAAHGPRGALAVIQGEQVLIEAIAGDHLAGELLALLPPLPAGPGRAVSLPTRAFQAAMTAYDPADSSRARGVLHHAGLSGGDIERLLAVGRHAVSSGAVGVYKSRHDQARLVGSLAYTDTPEGRYVFVRRADHISLIPTDLSGLRRRLHELLATETR